MVNSGGYSDYVRRDIFFSNVSFWFYFYCFIVIDSLGYFTSSKTSSHWNFILLTGYLHVQLG